MASGDGLLLYAKKPAPVYIGPGSFGTDNRRVILKNNCAWLHDFRGGTV
jgi:hypothetical protein